VVRHNPLGPRSYPGLLEQRYAYEVMGRVADLARFLRDVEDAEFWADISYLKIDGGPPSADQGGEPNGERDALLTISLFSAARAEESG
jgi:hypothetical protein